MTAECRREPRVAIDRPATARVAVRIDLIDLSRHGARARVSLPLAVGTLAKLSLGGGAERHARVVWTDDGITGFEFLAPLPVDPHTDGPGAA